MRNTQPNGKGNAVLMSSEPYTGAFTEGIEDENSLRLGDLLHIIWRRLWIIVLVAVLFAGAAVGLSGLQPYQYQASIKVLIGQGQGDGGSNNFGQDIQGLQMLTQTMAEVVQTRSVANAVIKDLNLNTSPESLLNKMTVEQTPETQIIVVSYEDSSPAKAQKIASAIGRAFSNQVSELSPSANAVRATVVEKATRPDSRVSPQPGRNGILALIVGLVVGLALALVLEYRDDSWRSPEEAEQVSGVPTFGVIRAFKPVQMAKGEGEE